jgi:acetyl-CoA C-acetyltransferase
MARRCFSRAASPRPAAVARAVPRAAVYLAGSGIVKVTRKKGATLATMGGEAISAALADAGIDRKVPSALYVGNMLSGILCKQQHLGPHLANAAGLDLIDSATAEACCGSGGAALRWGYMAIASGMAETVVVCGVEQMTHADTDVVTKGLASASHWQSEGSRGETFVSLNAAIMRAYMERYRVAHDVFAPFVTTAHANAASAAHAVLGHGPPVTPTMISQSRMLTPPVRLYDASPTCDGAAAVVLTSDRGLAAGGRAGAKGALVRIAGSASATDTLAIAARPDPLELRAVAASTTAALRQASVSRSSVDIFELHDAYSIMACVSLENAGFVQPGEGPAFAAEGHLSLGGSLPFATFGGLKARGHPVGATGVYQAAEMHLQLTGRGGANQVPGGPSVAVTQNIGGAGASVFTHVLVRD